MADGNEIADEGMIEIIPIHFDVPGHQIPLSTFIATAEQTEAVIGSLNRELFDGNLKYELFVLPPEEGTFLSRLGFVLLAGYGVVWSFTESDVGAAFIKGLTTQAPAYWAEMVGTEFRDKLIDSPDSEEAEADEEQVAKRRYESRIISEATKSFLQTNISDLEAIGVTPNRFRDAFEARNDFYNACSQTPELSGIGFDETANFPVKRSDFARLQVALPPKEDEPDEPWLTGVTVLKVTSPNWDRDDRHRQWKGKDGKGRERYFRIDDEYFWSLVKADQLSIHIIDTIKVQWAFHGKAESPRDARVLKVLEFNGETLSEPLEDNALSAILGRYAEISNDQKDLFDGQM